MKKIDISPGSTINSAIQEAIELAAMENKLISFDFNGVNVEVAGDSSSQLILRDWDRGMLRKTGAFRVTPYPKETLSDAELIEDALLIKERAERARQWEIEYERKMSEKKAALKKEMTAELALKDEAIWRQIVEVNSKDGYSAACVRYAEQWAILMQSRMQRGARLEEIAEQSSFDADTEGITGFMYGAAVSMLAQCWKYGEELRRWHNLKYQIQHEGEKANKSGGVTNPAMLRIGG